jgi:hypothetical protein
VIDKMVASATNALRGLIVIVILFGVLVGLVAWGRDDPQGVEATMANVAEAGVAIVNWVCNLIITTLD